jgi:glycosyltransferase involved in cell wall biosynthesis
MRIAFFSEVFLPKVDGVVNTLCRILEHLSRQGHPTLLITTRPDSRFPSIQETLQYPAANHPASSTQMVRVPGLSFPLYPEVRLAPPWSSFQKALDRFQPDLIHAVNPVTLGSGGVWFARQRGIPLVASYQTDLPGYATRWGYGFAGPLLWTLLRSIHNQAHLNLAPSEYTRRELKAHNFRRVKVWSRGVDTDFFNPTKRNTGMRARLSCGQVDAPLLLYTGRLSSEKRVDWLLSVMQAYPHTRLAIVGDGPQRAELENTFSGMNVQFTGFLHGEELAQAYASSDIFVFPSPNETFGNVVLEAMASGLPVVVPASGGIVDFVTHGRNGLMFASDDQDSQLHQVGKLIFHNELRQSIAAQARIYAEGKNWTSILNELIDEYERTIQLARRLTVARNIRQVLSSSA